MGLGTIAIAVLVRRVDRRLPAYLAAIGASVVLGLEARGVAVVGAVTPGLPSIGLPGVGLGDMPALLLPAAAIGLLIYADSGVTG